jgi:hypothetical protein
MAFKLIPPDGVAVDVAKGEQAAEAVFVAYQTAPEIAKFGFEVAQRYEMKRRCDPPTAEESQLANVFALAWVSGLEACTRAQDATGWACDVVVPDGVFVRVPGASVDGIHRAMAAAREVFRAAGVAPQAAAIGQHERLVYDVNGFQGPAPSDESAHAASVFDAAEDAALAACGGKVEGGYLSIEGFDTPEWQERMRTSAVLNWKGEKPEVASA